MPMGVGGPGLSNPPVQPASGSLWAFVSGSWQSAALSTLLAATPFIDATTFVVGDLDSTKRLTFQVDTQATASTLTLDVGAQSASRTLTVPVLTGSDTLATLSLAQVFTAAKTFNAGITASSSITGNVVIGDGATSATNVGVGGGNIYAGALVVAGNGFTSNGSVQGTFNAGMKVSGSPSAFTGAGPEFTYAGTRGSMACYDRSAVTFRGFDFNALDLGFQVGGGTVFAISSTGIAAFTNATDASAIGTAAITGTGGASFAKSLWVGGTAGNFVNVANATGAYKINSVQVVGPQITGYGTPTGGVNQGSFAAGSITLANLAAGVAKLILDLKTHGLLGT